MNWLIGRSMKVKYILSVLLMVLISSLDVTGQSNTILEKLQTSTEAWKNAYNSGDAKNLRSLYSEDAKYLSSHVPGLEALGRENVITNFQKGISTGGHIDNIKIISFERSGNIAYLLTQYQATNAGQTVSGRNLLVLRKVKRQWLIAVHMTIV
jgi:ketosteroid isomerase-like protein